MFKIISNKATTYSCICPIYAFFLISENAFRENYAYRYTLNNT